MLQNAHPIVGNAVKHQHPVAVGFCRAHFPAAKQHAIGCAHVEVFAMRADQRKRDVGLPQQVRRKRRGATDEGTMARRSSRPPLRSVGATSRIFSRNRQRRRIPRRYVEIRAKVPGVKLLAGIPSSMV